MTKTRKTAKAGRGSKNAAVPKGATQLRESDDTAAEATLIEALEDAPVVTLDGVDVDLDDFALPPAIEKNAFSSGDYPYAGKLDRTLYEASLRTLQIELLKLQRWVKATGERVAVVFEGRDSAGKGGTIQAVTQHLNPRSVRIVALSKPSPAEAGQWYFQRYVAEMPTAGEIVLFDRSWYNRAGVEPVMGFATAEETARFLAEAPRLERLLVEDGVRVFKFWLSIGREMQIKRLHDRRHDLLKQWKLSSIDYAGLNLWDAYSHAAERMLSATHSDAAPWTVVKANDKRRLRLACMRHLLLNVPYKGRDLAAIGGNDGRLLMDAPAFLKDGGES